jgi:electron transfer flavoprotein alpha subunit
VSDVKTIVCLKQVPSVSELKFDPQRRTLIREGVRNEINPFDRRAITFAVETRKRFGGEVVAMTMGPPQAKDALVEAVAMGADRSLHLLDRAFAGSDTLATARALSMAIKKETSFDIVLCGKYSVDAETGHIGPEVAELLGIPHVSGAVKVEFLGKPDSVVVEAETDFGSQRIQACLPILITTAERLLKPYSPTPDELEAAKVKPYAIIQASDLSTSQSLFGMQGSPTSVSEIYSIETKRKCRLIGGTPIQQVKELVNLLLDLGLFTRWKDKTEQKISVPSSRNVKDPRAFWVVAEVAQERVRSVTYELLGRGLQLSTKLESELCAIILGNKPSRDEMQKLAAYGADKIYVWRVRGLDEYSSDAYASLLAQAVEKFKPYVVITGSTSYGRDFMPRTAARLGIGMTSDCIGLELNEKEELVQLKPAFGGNIVAPIISRTTPQFATIRPGMLMHAKPNQSRKAEIIDLGPSDITPLSSVIEEKIESTGDVTRLDDAEVIVAAGAGLGGPQNLQPINELASVLDAPIATTRKTVDLGWFPSQLQVGLTGRSVSPQLYFAIAIRGAFNHMVGVGRAKTIVAINNDPNALIFKNCDYGIVGDYAELVPLLTKELRGVKLKLSGH